MAVSDDYVIGNQNMPDIFIYLHAIKACVGNSVKLIRWSLAIFVASFLFMLADRYFQRSNSSHLLIYSLLLIACTFACWSAYAGYTITMHMKMIESCLKDENKLSSIFKLCNQSYKNQLRWFRRSLFAFAVLLVVYFVNIA